MNLLLRLFMEGEYLEVRRMAEARWQEQMENRQIFPQEGDKGQAHRFVLLLKIPSSRTAQLTYLATSVLKERFPHFPPSLLMKTTKISVPFLFRVLMPTKQRKSPSVKGIPHDQHILATGKADESIRKEVNP